MRTTTFTLLLATVLMLSPLGATTLVSIISGTETATFVPGQSVTTPGGGPFNNLLFNFYGPSNSPLAAGTLFLLSQSYIDTPAALNPSVPGFIATSTGIADGRYVFAPDVILAGNVQYFFYANTPLNNRGSSVGTYSGGALYAAQVPPLPFAELYAPFVELATQDANFTLSGTEIPEPASVLMLSVGAVVGTVLRCRKRI